MLILGLSMAHPAAAQKYTITNLGTLGGPKSFAYDINVQGQIVGESETSEGGGEVGVPPTHAFFWSGAQITDIGTLGGRSSYAYSINQAGLVVGFSFTGGNSNGGAFLWGEGMGMKNLGTFPDGNLSEAYGINTAGQITGFSDTPPDFFDHAFLLSAGGMSDIGTLGGPYSYGMSINDSGQVVGYSGTADGAAHAFLWENNNMIDLGTFPGYSDSYANRINNKGQVVGRSSTAVGVVVESHAFLWENNNMIDLGTLGGDGSEALGINDLGQVVGFSTILVNGSDRSHAFISQDGQGMQDLNQFIPADSGWELVAASGINKWGQIVGWGYVNGVEVEHAFLLTPVGPKVLKVKINIKPWSHCKGIDPWVKWRLVPVAILSSPDFNAPRIVDRHSLTFGRTGDEDSLAYCLRRPLDVNHDGLKDLICYFRVGPTGFRCGDKEGVLKGKTVDGQEFEGTDEAQIWPCHRGRRHHHEH